MKKIFINKPKQPEKKTTDKLKIERIIFISDMAAPLLSLYAALRLLLGKDIQALQMSLIMKHCLVFALISFGLFSWIRSDRGASRYIAMDKISGLLICAVLANLLYHPLMLLMGSLPPLTPVVNALVFTAALFLPRFMAPFWKREEIKTNIVDLPPKIPAIVIGYNEQIGAYLREHETNPADRTPFPYHIQGILLNRPLSPDDLSPPFPVLGMVNDFVSIIQKLSVEGQEPQRFLIAQESLSYMPLRQIFLKFQGRGILSLRFDVSPASHEVNLRPLHIEDLLGKARLESFEDPTFGVAWQEVQALIDGARVLITGVRDPVIHQLACRIAGFSPKHLIMIDPSEHALARLKIKFDQLYPEVACEYILASITDRTTLERLIKTHYPQLIVHGDRVTHPDLAACNVTTTVQKNILSPLHFAQDIQKTEARLFILVNPQTPTRLMRLVTALISRRLQALDKAAHKKSPTRFLVINSGDVWNNLDSLTAFWSEQLSQGIKISIPSPDSVSYLLPAEEAARTILKAVAKALTNERTKGQILHLSGGEPSSFLHLIRSLSLLNGLIPEIDAKVKFSGKAMPSPSLEAANLLQSLTPGVTMGETSVFAQPEDEAFLNKLSDFLEKGQTAKIVALLENLSKEAPNTDAAHFFKLAG